MKRVEELVRGLGGLGASSLEAHLYLLLLKEGPKGRGELKGLNKWGGGVDEALKGLVGKGMVVLTREGGEEKIKALHPRMALTNLFKLYEERLIKELREKRGLADRLAKLLETLYEEG